MRQKKSENKGREKKETKKGSKKMKQSEKRENKSICRVSALCPARNFRSRSNQTMGCAHT